MSGARAAEDETVHRLADGVQFGVGADGVARLRSNDNKILEIEAYGVHGRAAARIPMSELARRGGSAVVVEQRHWPYFHLDGIVFWELGLAAAPVSTEPGIIAIRSVIPFETVDRTLRAHRSVGAAKEHPLRLPLFRLEREGDSPLFATVLRSDGKSWQPLPDGVHWALGGGGNRRIGLAFVLAESEDILWHDAGQALFSGELGSARPLREWNAPPLCARCANPKLSDARLVLRASGSGHELQLHYAMATEHEAPSHATLRIGGISLANFLVDERAGSAFFALEEGEPGSEEIVAELRGNSPRITLLSVGGQQLEVDGGWRVSWPELRPASRDRSLSELPHQLSSELLKAWPNPFLASEGTTIRYVLPRTVEEAFELEEDQRRGMKLGNAPPFGLNPSVSIHVYNVQGQLVRDLLDEAGAAGEYEIFWDGRDAAQRSVAAGAYFLRMELGDYSVTRRATLLKQ